MSSDYVPSIIQIDIPTFSEKYVNNQTETFYQLIVSDTYSNKKWTLEKSFDDFVALESDLAALIPNTPSIEGKSLFKVSAYGELNKRQFALIDFMNQCLVRKDIVSNRCFSDFIDLERNSPELLYNAPLTLTSFEDLPLGVTDFIYREKEQMLFVICSDMNLTSRVDAYITNINLPWEQKEESHIAVGAFFAFKVIFDANKGFKFEKVFAKSFAEQTGSIYYDEESLVLSIGLASGLIVFYKIMSDSMFTQYDFMCEHQHHRGMVTGVAYDSKTGFMYSCGADKKLVVAETNYLDVPTEVYESLTEYTKLVLDRKNDRLFLTNEAGEVDIFVTSVFPPNLANTVVTSSDGPITGIAMDYKNCHMFTCSDSGMICVLDLSTPGKEKHIKEISSFEGDDKLKSIVFDSNSRELIVGDESGRFVIWNLKTGQPVYVLDAHMKAIHKIFYDMENKIILSGGADNTLKSFKLPDKWIKEEVRKFEEMEIKNMSDTMAMLKLQKSLERDKDYNSDEDSLNGWDYLPDLDNY